MYDQKMKSQLDHDHKLQASPRGREKGHRHTIAILHSLFDTILGSLHTTYIFYEFKSIPKYYKSSRVMLGLLYLEHDDHAFDKALLKQI